MLRRPILCLLLGVILSAYAATALSTDVEGEEQLRNLRLQVQDWRENADQISRARAKSVEDSIVDCPSDISKELLENEETQSTVSGVKLRWITVHVNEGQRCYFLTSPVRRKLTLEEARDVKAAVFLQPISGSGSL